MLIESILYDFIYQVFEDALEDFDEVAEEAEPVVNNKSKKTFKLKRLKSKKSDHPDTEVISLEQGLIEGQHAIDLFFDNKFAESREVAQRQ